MGRPAKFTDDDLLDAALSVVAEMGGEATVEQIAARLGARVNTLYHRFASRRELLACLWVRSIRRFHRVLLAALVADDPTVATVGAARAVVEYCAHHPDEARAMTLFRHEALVADPPARLADEIAGLNDAAFEAVHEVTRRRFGHTDGAAVTVMRAALQHTPYGLVRPYIGGATPQPPWLADLAAAAVAPMLAAGDRVMADAPPPHGSGADSGDDQAPAAHRRGATP